MKTLKNYKKFVNESLSGIITEQSDREDDILSDLKEIGIKGDQVVSIKTIGGSIRVTLLNVALGKAQRLSKLVKLKKFNAITSLGSGKNEMILTFDK